MREKEGISGKTYRTVIASTSLRTMKIPPKKKIAHFAALVKLPDRPPVRRFMQCLDFLPAIPYPSRGGDEMPAIAILGAQWGDESKGKLAHLLSRDADFCVRFNGGTNAGHTVVVDGEEIKFHLLPAGSLWNRTSVLGNGMVIDPFALAEELKSLEERGLKPDIYISAAAHFLLPYHRIVEQLSGAEEGIGTTGRGIGPAYRDKAERTGLRVGDLLSPSRFCERLERNLRREQRVWEGSAELQRLDPQRLADEVLQVFEPLRERITDTAQLLNRALDRGKKIIFEGAQGALLDIDFGTYPYVTSSNATIGGIGIGAGVSPRRVERVIGVVKAYTTRVGEGPFPTEEFGEIGQRLRERGREFGATTGRPRRCGWLDLVALKFAQMINGFTELALMKLDVLSGLPELRVATRYRCGGELVEDLPPGAEALERCKPVYEMLPGWEEEIGKCRHLDELPPKAQAYIAFIEERLGVPVSIISVGPEAEASILRAPVIAESF
jgi:adenylosuccinate synthase